MFEMSWWVRSRRIVWLVVLGAMVALCPRVTAQSQPAEEKEPLSVSIEASSVSITGASPTGRVVAFGVARDRVGYMARTLRFDGVVTADEMGAASYQLPGTPAEGSGGDGTGDEPGAEVSPVPVPPRSVWAVVDLTTGEYVLAAPQGSDLRRVEAPARGLGAAARFLDQDGRYLDVLLIRPESGPDGVEAAGLWGLRVGDGGEQDADGVADSRISLAFAELWPLADSPPAPETLAPKDVLLGVDPENLEIYAVQLAAPPADGEGE